MSNKVQIFKISDFLGWQRSGELTLSPSFQRRPVWRPAAKSYLIDTIVRGLPVPLIFVRERLDLKSQRTIREVVDGQQRLRTLFTYIDPKSLVDYDDGRDGFDVLERHNPDIAGTGFGRLDEEVQKAVLGYEFGTHVLPAGTEDRDVLMIFARLNSTGVRLNGQELRNAEYFGEMKKLMYQLAYQQLERWRTWGIFSEDAIARMVEVEFVSDVTLTMMSKAVSGKTQDRLDKMYKRNDEGLDESNAISTRFRRVMDTIEESVGNVLPSTVFSSPVNFYSLWTLVYDLHYGIESELKRGTRAQPVAPDRLRRTVIRGSDRITEEDVPEPVLDAIRRASSDTGRRKVRHDFLLSVYG